jgi:hypothetical protein
LDCLKFDPDLTRVFFAAWVFGEWFCEKKIGVCGFLFSFV